MWEWLEKNREWVFSGIGVTSVLFFVWLFRSAGAKARVVFGKNAQPEIVVRINGAVTSHPFHGMVHALAIIAENHSGKEMVIGNFMLKTKTGRIYVKADGLTGAPQRRQVLDAGDSSSFHILAGQLKEMGLPPEAYLAAVVETPLNKEYQSGAKELQRAIAELLA